MSTAITDQHDIVEARFRLATEATCSVTNRKAPTVDEPSNRFLELRQKYAFEPVMKTYRRVWRKGFVGKDDLTSMQRCYHGRLFEGLLKSQLSAQTVMTRSMYSAKTESFWVDLFDPMNSRRIKISANETIASDMKRHHEKYRVALKATLIEGAIQEMRETGFIGEWKPDGIDEGKYSRLKRGLGERRALSGNSWSHLDQVLLNCNVDEVPLTNCTLVLGHLPFDKASRYHRLSAVFVSEDEDDNPMDGRSTFEILIPDYFPEQVQILSRLSPDKLSNLLPVDPWF